MFLAGDIGGTNTRVAFFEGDPSHLTPVVIEVFPSGQHKGPEEIARKFLEKNKHSLESACFGIAGPVRDGRAERPNLPWVVEASRLGREIGIENVSLINDLEANAPRIAVLAENDFVSLNAGAPSPTGNSGLISARTGLGEAGQIKRSDGYHPFPSE